MHLRLPRSAPVLLLATGALTLALTGGAVAAGLVTSADIRDGTVASVDVKDGTLGVRDLSGAAQSSLRGVTGVTKVVQLRQQAFPHEFVTLSATCPAGKVAIGAGGSWTDSEVPPMVWMDQTDPKTWHARGENPNDLKADLQLTVWCVSRS
jgi:hypothetical protein